MRSNFMSTIEDRKLKFIARQTDAKRNTVTDFYIEPPNTPGPRSTSKSRSLIARYVIGGADDLPIVEGLREFATGIPDHWTEQHIIEFVSEFEVSWPEAPETKQ
jgi:hypothetical protein